MKFYTIATSLLGMTNLNSSPSGSYTGSTSILGQTLNVEIMATATTVDLIMDGATSLTCSDEAYTYANGEVTLTTAHDDGDCIHDNLDTIGAEIDYVRYDEATNSVEVKVKKGWVISYTIDLLPESSFNNLVAPDSVVAPDPVHPIKCAADVAELATDVASAMTAIDSMTASCKSGFSDACLASINSFMTVVDTALGHTGTALDDCTDGTDSECNTDLAGLVTELETVTADLEADLAACPAKKIKECATDVIATGKEAVTLVEDVIAAVSACKTDEQFFLNTLAAKL